MEVDEVVVCAVVVAVIFGAIVEGGAVGSEGHSDEGRLVNEFGGGGAGERNGMEKSYVGALRGKAHLGVTHARDLIAGGLNAVSAGPEVGAVDGEDFVGRVFEYLRGPERAVDIRAHVLKLGGHASVENADAVKDRLGH